MGDRIILQSLSLFVYDFVCVVCSSFAVTCPLLLKYYGKKDEIGYINCYSVLRPMVLVKKVYIDKLDSNCRAIRKSKDIREESGGFIRLY